MRSRTLISIISLLLILSMVFMTGCGGGTNEPEETTPEITEPINVAVMNGPTGMGMVDLLDNPNYNVEIFQSPTDAVPKILSGEVDIACLPSNMAAVLYQKSEGMVVCVSPMVMGVLSILGNGVEVNDIQDLKGQTIVAAGQGGTPEYALQAVLESNGLTMGEDVQVTWLANHADVNTQLLTTPGTIAMVPEPFASVAQAKGGDAVTKLFDMNSLWNEAVGQDFPMGVLVATRDFVEFRSGDLYAMLIDLQASIDDVNTASDEVAQKIVDAGFLGDPAIAKAAIPNCSLCLYADEEGDHSFDKGIEIMKVFNETMFGVNPAAVGGALPEDDLYFTGK